MEINKKYRLTLEDESSLRKKINFSATAPVFILIIVFFATVAATIGVLVFANTPLKKQLPGYLKDSERSASEAQHMRLDSLVQVYEVNEAYLNGILSALYPSETDTVVTETKEPVPLSPDSLMDASEEEKKFMETIRERDKYNITYPATAVAQNMRFVPVNNSAVISEKSKDKFQSEILIPTGGTISSIAEGKVISVSSSPKISGAYEVIIQHPKGFLSKISRLNGVTVQPGDRVSAGQIIATRTAGMGTKSNLITLELWHDGEALLPSRYLEQNRDIE